eukprot:4604763-Pyramimonas_sp.AAC.1
MYWIPPSARQWARYSSMAFLSSCSVAVVWDHVRRPFHACAWTRPYFCSLSASSSSSSSPSFSLDP